MSSPEHPDVASLIDLVRQHPRLFVLTGAGCSTASGLGDYRDAEGQWKRRQPITGHTFLNNSDARRRYWARSAVGWPHFSAAQAGRAHQALAALQRTGQAHHLVTQNVDQLHQRAGHRNVTDLHGVLATVSCQSCAQGEQRDGYQSRLLNTNPWLSTLVASARAAMAPDGDADLEAMNLDMMIVPVCTVCGGMMKPDVVFFGENVAKTLVEQLMARLATSDALLVAGSSLMVFSGFRFCREAARLGKPLFIVNEGRTRADDMAQLKVGGDCGDVLAALAQAFTDSTDNEPRAVASLAHTSVHDDTVQP